MLRLVAAVAMVACVFVPAVNEAVAQETAPAVPQQEGASAQAVTAPVIPALTPLRVEIVDAQGSALSKPDSHFALRLAEPIIINGQTLVPAGAMGEGEVVHAKKASASGGPGELVLAARWLDVGGRQLKLRSLHWAGTGTSNIKDVNRAMMATAMTVPAAAVIGLFVTGKEIVVPAGTVADAKVALDFTTAP